jgi:hypothetical protein
MKEMGKVSIPQDAFMAVIRVNDWEDKQSKMKKFKSLKWYVYTHFILK